MSVYVYMSIYVCMYICIYICMFIYIYIYLCEDVYSYTHMHTHTHIHIYSVTRIWDSDISKIRACVNVYKIDQTWI